MSLFADTFFQPFQYQFSLPVDDFEAEPAPNQVTSRPKFFNNSMMGPRVDIHEVQDSYNVSVELPGVKRENVKVSLDSNTRKLTISGETRSEYGTTAASAQAQGDSNGKTQAAKGDEVSVTKTDGDKKSALHHHGPRPLVSERFYGCFSRSFILPKDANVDDENVKGKFESGVLKLTIPKKTETKKSVRNVTIEDVAE